MSVVNKYLPHADKRHPFVPAPRSANDDRCLYCERPEAAHVPHEGGRWWLPEAVEATPPGEDAVSAPLSEADLDALEAAEKALRGRDAPPDLAEEAMDIIAATPRLLAEVRRLRGARRVAAAQMRERAAEAADRIACEQDGSWIGQSRSAVAREIEDAIRALPTEPRR